jgi:DNA-binding IclR family transcriptional regulator
MMTISAMELNHLQPGKGDFGKTLQKSIAILEQVACFQHGVGVTQLSDTLLINKSTVSKTLSVFESLGYVTQNADSELFSLGPKLLFLGQKMLDSLDLLTVARPVILKLNNKTNETINLAAYTNRSLVYIDTIPGNHSLKLTNSVGAVPVISCSAVGKAMLAFMPPEARNEVLENIELTANTKYSIKTKEELKSDIEAITRRGFSVSNEETHLGVVGIAAPVFGFSRNLIAVLAVTGPKIRFPENTVRAYGQLVCESAKEISRKMGFQAENSGGEAGSPDKSTP